MVMMRMRMRMVMMRRKLGYFELYTSLQVHSLLLTRSRELSANHRYAKTSFAWLINMEVAPYISVDCSQASVQQAIPHGQIS